MTQDEEKYQQLYINKMGFESINGFPEFKIIPDLCDVRFKGKYWTILAPKNREGAAYYGKGTDWCTAVTGNNAREDYYKFYLNRFGGKYYICFNANTKQRYQLHFENGTFGMFCDEYDDPVKQWNQLCNSQEASSHKKEMNKEISIMTILKSLPTAMKDFSNG